MHLTILTGASRGLGAAMAEQLLKQGHRLLTISRHAADLWVVQGADLEQWPMDLADPGPVAARLEAWLRAQADLSPVSVTLINNAAVVSPPGPLAHTTEKDLSQAVRVGLEAPLLLSAAFLRATADWTVPRRVLFISSGLGRRAMAGAATYCATKAGLDHLARALALGRGGPGPTAPRWCRWHLASSTPTCRCNCAAPTRRCFLNANASWPCRQAGNSIHPPRPPPRCWPTWRAAISVRSRWATCATA